MSVKWIKHQDSQVLYADFRDRAETEQQIQVLDEIDQILQTSSMSVPILINVEGVGFGAEYMARVKEWGKKNELKIKRQALLGVTGLKTILFQGYLTFTGQKNIKPFNTEKEALDWLASQGS